ncbi:uncharacterized protein KGF55_001396 [Candida pseudojiufengensis]|uniref:uncharacterized protein n=1 Tax=Candida pseudojiufengensis TaxID=497109 RepID=UPI002223F942|nr:uncharacterized protein KGF55_001396 [Candida pseudojiufengensis]KAI5965176.1 hypothetical protein KGF55_001396 [Candida pseudojiufengensis]
MKFLSLQLIIFISTLISVNSYQLYCKCQCNGAKAIITKVDKCGECTKEYCLSEQPKLCEIENNMNDENKEEEDAGDDNSSGKITKPKETSEDIIISCYQVESLKDGIIVYSFFGIILALMIRLFYSSFRG